MGRLGSFKASHRLQGEGTIGTRTLERARVVRGAIVAVAVVQEEEGPVVVVSPRWNRPRRLSRLMACWCRHDCHR